MRKLAGFACAAALACLLAAPARAQSVTDKYPERAIKIIVPFPPGGSVDVLGRLIAQRTQEHWGQSVIVETRPGASTMIGTAAAAKADPDGYTLLLAVSNHTTNPALHAAMPYDALKDFAPIALLARTPVVLYAHPSLPAKDTKELIALGKAKTHTLNFGSAGTGSMTHLTGELLKIQAGIEMLHIVYRGGTPALNDLLAGHLPLQFATVAQALPQYKAGQLRALGISSAERYASVPDIPTFREQGIDLVTTEWYGLRQHAEANRCEAQCRDETHHGVAQHGRPPRRDRADAFDAGGAGRVHPGGNGSLGAVDQEAGAEGGVTFLSLPVFGEG